MDKLRLEVALVALAACGHGSGGGSGSNEGSSSASDDSGDSSSSGTDDGVDASSSDGSSGGSEDEGSSGTTGPAVCGDGVRADDEACDDGNLDDGDACSASCEPTIMMLDGPLSSWIDPDDIPLVATGDAFAMAWMHGEDASLYDQLRYAVFDATGTLGEPTALTSIPSYLVKLGADASGAALLTFQNDSIISYRFVAPGGALDMAGGFDETLADDNWFVPAAHPAALGDGRFCVLAHIGTLRCTVDQSGLGDPIEIAPTQDVAPYSTIDYAQLSVRDGGLVASYIGYVGGMISRELRARAITADGAADGAQIVLMPLDQNGAERPSAGWRDGSGEFRVGFGLDTGFAWWSIGASGPVNVGAQGSLPDGERTRVLQTGNGDLHVLWRTRVTEELGPQHVIHTCTLWAQRYSADLTPLGDPQAIIEPQSSHCVTTYGAAVNGDGALMIVWHRVLTDEYPPIAYLEGLLQPSPP